MTEAPEGNMGHVTWSRPFQGLLVIPRPGLAIANLRAEFEAPIFNRYEDTKTTQNVENEAVLGDYRSLKLRSSTHCNFSAHQLTLVIFGRVVAERVCYQMVIVLSYLS